MKIEADPTTSNPIQRGSPDPLQERNDSSGHSFLPHSEVLVEQGTCTRIAKQIRSLLGNMKYQILITVLTIYSLFSDDFRTAAFDAQVDIYFDVLSLIVMGLFSVEIVLSCLVIDGYILSFFFWLDLLSTATIIFDVNFITDDIFVSSGSGSVAQLASQSKASRAATRAVRIMKLFRVIRIIKIYKNGQKAKEIKEKNKQLQVMKEKRKHRKDRNKLNDSGFKGQNSNMVQNSQNAMSSDFKRQQTHPIYPQEQVANENEEEIPADAPSTQDNFQFSEEELEKAMKKESKIGKILSDLSMKKIIVVVLLMMFLIPLFNIDVFRDSQNAWDFSLANEQKILQTSESTVTNSELIGLIEHTINMYVDVKSPIIQYTSPFQELPLINNVDMNILRNDDLLSSSQDIDVASILTSRPSLTKRTDTTDPQQLSSLTVILDQSAYNKTEALFSMGKTLFVCLVLLVLMILFSNDIDSLLVEPIEGMMEKLMLMAKDPQSAAKEELNTNVELETTVISNAIIKIGALLSIVFGSAGAEIIGANIIEEGDMNPMIQGKKKCAIFGFCDIRQFTEVTEVLQEEILVFVNKIGSLVHESVYRYGGSANKNIGQAFLLVWKIPEAQYVLDEKTNKIEWKRNRQLNVLADFSVLGFVKTLVKIHKDPFVLEYGNDPRIKSMMKDFSVKMGFGLHIGWAIEGAIGSQYKIDASYLSPNVNMASRLEAATRQFGVDFLLSQDLYDLLTPEMKDYCRNIDRVTVKGSEKPIRLYTVDLNYEKITPPMNKALKYPNPKERLDSESKRAINMEWLKQDEVNNYNAKRFVESKKELSQVLVNAIPEDFRRRFELGVNSYLKGKWGDARLHLSEALKFKNSDGPTKTLLGYMKKFSFNAPSDWKQYRSLTSK